MPYVLSTEIERVRAQVATLDSETCVPVLEAVWTDLEHLDPAEVDPDDVARNGLVVASRVFDVRLALQERLRAMVADQSLTPECMRSIRRADLAGRYLVDYVAGALGEEEATGLEWLVNPALRRSEGVFDPYAELRTGDLLVTRGNAVSSAGIAHMGQTDSQFSHNVLIHADPRTGELWTVEAYLEQGAISQPLSEFLAHGIDRIVILRHPDPEVARLAAEAAWTRVHFGGPIDYDADFAYDDHQGLFCSEVPRWSYGSLVGRADDVPIAAALTQFPVSDLFRQMGVRTPVTSAPADVLYDPRFTLVAEYRNPHELVKLRRQDAAVEGLLRWIEEYDYTIEPLGRHRQLVSVALVLRRIPGLREAVRSRIHPHGDKEFLVTSLALMEAGEALYEDLVADLGDAPALTTFAALQERVEELRRADLERWREDPKSARYHHIVHP